jgi:DNA-binding NarL/FixJ family response regulator
MPPLLPNLRTTFRERNESMDPIRVVIADDDDAILRTLSDLIFTDASLELVGVAHETSEVIALALAQSPDVALIDVRMPGGGGAKAAREIRERSSSTHVVAFSNYQDAEVVLEMFRAGAYGYVAKDGSIDDVLRAIHRAAEGRTTISTGSLGDVAERLGEFHLHRHTDAVREIHGGTDAGDERDSGSDLVVGKDSHPYGRYPLMHDLGPPEPFGPRPMPDRRPGERRLIRRLPLVRPGQGD